MLVVSYANKCNKFKDNFEASMKQYNFNYKIVGIGEKWINFIHRAKTVLDYIKTVDVPYIISIDCYDAFACRNSSNIVEEFQNTNLDIIVSSEDNCLSPKNCHPIIKWPDKYLNAGFYMGKREYVIKMLEWMVASGHTDDQKAMALYAELNPHNFNISLDIGSVFCNTVPFFSYTGKNSYFIHCPASPLQLYYRYNNLGSKYIKGFKSAETTESPKYLYLVLLLFIVIITTLLYPKYGIYLVLLVIICYIIARFFIY